MDTAVTEQNVAEADRLPVATELLNGQFLLHAPLQSGGFGITYIARDSLARQVVVKECYPAELCRRDGLRVMPSRRAAEKQFRAIKNQFIREARQLAKLVHPNIVAVHQVFEENNTAYMALDKIKGIDLITLVEEEPGRITNGFLTSALRQSLTAVSFIHENALLHRDLSPDNIMIDEEGHVTLIDFGASQEHSDKNTATVFAVKDGYSPYEFYLPDGRHTFSSDFYSLAATFHYLITGQAPVDAYTRLQHLTSGKSDPYTPLATGDWKCDYNLLATIDRALKMHQKNRFQSAADWLNDLDATASQRPVRSSARVFDPNLEKEIAQIVQTTNTHLETHKKGAPPRKLTHAELQKERAAQAEQKRTIVDIFGQPIEDIDAWQEEQEREIQHRKTVKDKSAANATEKNKGLGGLKNKFLSGLKSRRIPNSKNNDTPRS